MDLIRKKAPFIVAGILLAHFVASLIVSSQESMIFDEKAHIPAAYSYVQYGDMRLNPEHPPILKDLAGLPLLALDLKFPLETPEWQSGINEQWTVGDMFINCSRPELLCNDADTILFWSRIPIILLTLLLGFFLYRWTKELGGTLAGVFAVTLFAFDPNIIAHNHYVTTDLGIAAFLFFSFYFFVKFLKNPSPKNIVVAGLFLGLAELVKFSAVLLFPIFGLFVILYALTTHKPPTDVRSTFLFKLQKLFEYGFKFLGSVLVCFALIWVVYAANTYAMPGEKLSEAADMYLGQKNAFAMFAHDFTVSTSQSFLLKPYSEYFLGVFMVFARVAGGNTHYFLGEVTDDASAWYFPIVFLLKETLPFLFLLAFSIVYTLSRMVRAFLAEKSVSVVHFLARSFHNKIAQYLGVFFILFYSYISIAGNLNIGFRHLFPIMPFLYMFIAKTVFDFYKRQQENVATKKLTTILISIVTFVIIAIPVISYPSYLSYFNAVTGGHLNGYKYVTDSNYDWGQDLKHLQRFVDTFNKCKTNTAYTTTNCSLAKDYPAIDHIRVDYFGGGSPSYYLKEKYISWWDKRDPEPGWYAISSFFYQESIYKKKAPGEKDYSWLKNITPVTRAGDSFFIYYIPEQESL